MFNKFKSMTLAASLTAIAVTAASPAQARERYRDDGNDAALVIGAGIVGLAIGAALADRGDRHYYNQSYYPQRRYVRVQGYPDYYYYYDNAPQHYYRDRYYSRNYRNWNNSRNINRWDRGQQRVDRWYGRDYRDHNYRDRPYRDRNNRYYRGY